MAGALAMGVLSVRAEVPYEHVLAFGMGDWLCTQPQGALVETEDGYLYGTTQSGGRPNLGTVFRMSLDGTEFKILHHFGPALTRDGLYPRSGLTLGDDQYLYGTTEQGGEFNFGTVYRIKTDGSDYSIVYSFVREDGDGVYPMAELTLSEDDWIYGTTKGGSTSWWSAPGTVFRLRTEYTELQWFPDPAVPHDGRNLHGGLLLGSDGRLHGYTHPADAANRGTIFGLTSDGAEYEILWRFVDKEVHPRLLYAGLVVGPDGALYGTSSGGGEESGVGTVYRFDVGSQMLSLVHSFTSGTLGNRSSSERLLSDDGYFYGSLEGGGAGQGVIYRMRPDGADYQALHRFRSTREEGSPSYPALTEGPDGYLYGVARGGGQEERGTIYRLLPDGTEFSVLHHFASSEGDGSRPEGRLLLASDRHFYGTTKEGGVSGHGTIFRFLAGGGDYEVSSGWNDWQYPESGLIEGTPGKLYGTTSRGGFQLRGTVCGFDTESKTVTLLHRFTGEGVEWDGRTPGGAELLLRDDGGTEHGGLDTSAAQTFVITVQPALGPPLLRIEVSLDGLCTITWEAIPGCLSRAV